MPVKSPFFPRTSALCQSMKWKEWAGYYAVCSYEVIHDVEYHAFRNSAGLLDITPLYKYQVTGADSAAFLSRLMVRDISKMKVGRVTYCCWCTHDGKVVDDGTVMRRGENEFFVTSADPSFSWFSRFQRGFQVNLKDVSSEIAGLALQGPCSYEILQQLVDFDLGKLRYFRTTPTKLNEMEVHISRTGYTGDLGYEIWMDNNHALGIWDSIIEVGKNYNIRPAGLDALDMTRIEAGLILKDVDYFNALHALIPDRKSSPFELNLGWAVDLDRPPFNGRNSLVEEKRKGSNWTIVGLDLRWNEIEDLYAGYGLPPEVGGHAWRSSIPVYQAKSKRQQIGYATSGTWSPILKKYIALATLKKEYEINGSEVQMEFTVEHIRHTVTAVICQSQFFNPDRKRSLPNQES